MQLFAVRLRQRTQELGLTNVEVARRAGLAPRRYAHYAKGDREPDLATAVRIAKALATTPNYLLGFDQDNQMLDRLIGAVAELEERDQESLVVQAEALLRHRASKVD